MEEKTIMCIAIITAGIGLSILYSIFITSEPLHAKYIENNLDKTVQIHGRVLYVEEQESRTEVVIMREEIVSVTFFEKIEAIEGSDISIIADIQEYKNTTSIIGKSLKQS